MFQKTLYLRSLKKFHKHLMPRLATDLSCQSSEIFLYERDSMGSGTEVAVITLGFAKGNM